MQGIALHIPVNEFAAAARAEGILVIPAAENVARLLPPLIIGEAEIAEAIARFDAACLRLEGRTPDAMTAQLGGTSQ